MLEMESSPPVTGAVVSASLQPVFVAWQPSTWPAVPSVMDEKVINDAAASIRSLAEMHGRNADWAEQAVRQSANLPASDALSTNVVDLIASDVPDLLSRVDGRVVQVAGRPFALATRSGVPEAISSGIVSFER